MTSIFNVNVSKQSANGQLANFQIQNRSPPSQTHNNSNCHFTACTRKHTMENERIDTSIAILHPPSPQQHSIMHHLEKDSLTGEHAKMDAGGYDVSNNNATGKIIMPSCIHMLEDHDFPSLNISSSKAGLDPENGIGYRGSPFGGHGPLGGSISPVELARSRLQFSSHQEQSTSCDKHVEGKNDKFQDTGTNPQSNSKSNSKQKKKRNENPAKTIQKLQRKLLQSQLNETKIRSHWIFKLLEDRRQLNIQLVHSKADKQLQYQALLEEHEGIVEEIRREHNVKCAALEQELLQRRNAGEVVKKKWKTELECLQQELLAARTEFTEVKSSNHVEEDKVKVQKAVQVARNEVQREWTEQRSVDSERHTMEVSSLKNQLAEAAAQFEKMKESTLQDLASVKEELQGKNALLSACAEKEQSLQAELCQLKKELKKTKKEVREKDDLGKGFQDEIERMKLKMQDLGEQLQLKRVVESSATLEPIVVNKSVLSEDDSVGLTTMTSMATACIVNDEQNHLNGEATDEEENEEFQSDDFVLEAAGDDNDDHVSDSITSSASQENIVNNGHDKVEHDDNPEMDVADQKVEEHEDLSLAQRVTTRRSRRLHSASVIRPLAEEEPDKIIQAHDDISIAQSFNEGGDITDKKISAQTGRRLTRSTVKLQQQSNLCAEVTVAKGDISGEIMEEENHENCSAATTTTRSRRSLLSSKPLREVTTRNKRKQSNAARRQSLIETGPLQPIEEEGSVVNDASFTSQESSISSSSASSKENQLNSSTDSTNSGGSFRKRRKGANGGLLSSFTAPKLKSKRRRRRV